MPADAETTPTADTIDLVGLWRLVRVTGWKDGALRLPEVMGPRPGGYIAYSRAGRMVVVLDRRSVTRFDERFGPDPIFAYAGTYTRKGDVVTHHLEVCTKVSDIGTDYVRRIEVEGDKLLLCTEPVRKGDSVYVSKLEWVRDGAFSPADEAATTG